MEVFQGNSHIGIVVLFDFGDGEGYRLGVLQSTSTGNAPLDDSRLASLGRRTYRMTGAGYGNRADMYQDMEMEF